MKENEWGREKRHYHHHLVVPPARIFLNLSRHSSLSFITSGRSLGRYSPYPDRASVCMFELVALLLICHVRGSMGEHHLWARPCSPEVSCMSGSSNFDIFVIGGRWPYSCCLVGCCLQSLNEWDRHLIDSGQRPKWPAYFIYYYSFILILAKLLN